MSYFEFNSLSPLLIIVDMFFIEQVTMYVVYQFDGFLIDNRNYLDNYSL